MSAESKPESSSGSSPTPEGGGGGNKLVLILTLVNLLACVGMGGVLFMSFKKEKDQAKITDIQAEGGDEHGGGEEHASADAHGEKKEEGHGGGHDAPKADAHGGGGEHGGGHGESAKKAAPSEYGKMIPLEMFSINLATPGGTQQRFARVNISVEVPTEDVETEVNSKIPQVRNAIIDLFNSKRPNDLATSEGRDYLKEEIRSALNSFLTSGKVKGVYFTNFVVTS